MRKKPWAGEMIASRTDCVITEPAALKGTWKQFSSNGEIHLEIGAGKGDYWIKMGNMYPESAWIALEKNYDCAAIALKKSLEVTGSNMKFIIGDAALASEWFAEGELDVIHLNFSDPWPKKSHTKRRLTSSSFLKDYRHILKKDGKLIFKTDNSSLFEYSLLSFEEDGWKLVDVSVDFRRNEHPEDAITEYESNFMAAGQPIYRAIWQPER